MVSKIYDVWVNWSDGSNVQGRVPEFFEWDKNDSVDLFEEIALIKVEPELYSFIELEYRKIPNQLLELMKGQSRKRNPKTNRVRKEDYAAVITDGERTIAIFTEGDNKPRLKSRLVPRQDAMVMRMVKDLETAEVWWEKPTYEESPEEDVREQIMSSDLEYTIGLTRKERELREILMEAVFRLSCSENDNEIMYWYVELFPEMYGDHDTVSRDDKMRAIWDELKTGWTDRHLEFGNSITKHYKDSRYTWEKLTKTEKEKVKR